MTSLNRYLLLLFAAALAALFSVGGTQQAITSPARAAAQQVPG